MEGKVISFDYIHSPEATQPIEVRCWARVSEVFPTSTMRSFVPKTAENTSPKLTSKLHRKFL